MTISEYKKLLDDQEARRAAMAKRMQGLHAQTLELRDAVKELHAQLFKTNRAYPGNEWIKELLAKTKKLEQTGEKY